MRRDFIILCLALAVIAFSTPASAAPSSMNPLKVDINGENPGHDPCRTQPGWEGWDFPRTPTIMTFTKAFTVPPGDTVSVVLKGVKNNGSLPGSRMRNEEGIENLGRVHQDLFLVATTGADNLCGLDYIQMDISMPASQAGKTFQITTWSYDIAFNSYHDSNMDDYVAWGIVNPSTNGGYPVTMRNVPILARTSLFGGEHDSYQYSSTFEVTLDSLGKVTIYGWWDGDSWEGSYHMPLNGFMIVPEPMTVALLGLGGLVLLRRGK